MGQNDKQNFKTDIGQVEVDPKSKKITVDGKPIEKVLSEKTAMELLLKDLAIDRTLMEGFKSNLAALKTWLPHIGNRKARETFHTFIEDSDQVLAGMIRQRNLQLITLVRMEKEWQKNQPTAGASSSDSAAPGDQPTATPAPEPPKKQSTPPTSH